MSNTRNPGFCDDGVALLVHLPRVSLSDGSLFLGVPVGGENFMQHFCAETLSTLDNIPKKSSRLHSGLGKFLILRACFGACRVNHLLRVLDFKDGSRLAVATSAPFRRALEDLLQSTTTDEQFTMACMASRRGGLGLKNPTWTHGPAFPASSFKYAASSDSISAKFWEEVSVAWIAVRSATVCLQRAGRLLGGLPAVCWF